MSFKEKWNRMNRKADQAIKNAKARKTAQPDTDNTGRKEKKPGGHKVLRAIAAVCLVGIMLMCVAGCVLTVWAFDTLNTDQQMLDLSMQKAKYTTIFYADDGETELARAYDPDAGNRIWVDYDQMPKCLLDATVAVEDKRFWEHNGVDFLTTSKAGTITSGEDRFMEWKTTDGSYENTQYAAFDTFFEGLFEKNRFLDILKNFICFNVDGEKTFKVLAAYHQYFAVKKAIASTQKATVTDGKGGVFWHTQGSGKSLSMVFYAHYLQEALESPTIVVITDRNDLDDQLYGQFARCKDFLRQTPQHAQSRTHLKELLANRQANGIIFTTMQKFEESNEALSERRNIIVMADEAHRGQYGLNEKVVVKQKDNGEIEALSALPAL